MESQVESPVDMTEHTYQRAQRGNDTKTGGSERGQISRHVMEFGHCSKGGWK
jgi:hypothetical protein